MNLFGNQRWLDGRSSFRRPDEQIRRGDFEIAEIEDDTTAKAFVLHHHYAKKFPSARFRFGLYEKGELVGVAVFSHPVRNEVLTRVFGPGTERITTDLGRFVLLDRVKGNGETHFLRVCFERLARDHDIEGVTSFSDPMPRTTTDGVKVMPGHVGTIYQAHNARYLGRAKAESLFLLPDGTTFSRRARSKVVNVERGWEHPIWDLVKHGAPVPRCVETGIADRDELRAWWQTWSTRLLRKFRHGGNHKFAWPLVKKMKRILPKPNPCIYPKAIDVAVEIK